MKFTRRIQLPKAIEIQKNQHKKERQKYLILMMMQLKKEKYLLLWIQV